MRDQSECECRGTKWQISKVLREEGFSRGFFAVFNRTPGVNLTGPSTIETQAGLDS